MKRFYFDSPEFTGHVLVKEDLEALLSRVPKALEAHQAEDGTFGTRDRHQDEKAPTLEQYLQEAPAK